MNMLIIKKDMCTKSRKHIPLTYSPKEKRLINMDIPFSQIWTFHFRRVLIARSCAGAFREVPSAVLMGELPLS